MDSFAKFKKFGISSYLYNIQNPSERLSKFLKEIKMSEV